MPLKQIDYSKTVIYKFVCNDLTITDLYVGHTTDFIRRKREHKHRCYNQSYKYKIYDIIRQNGGWDNWSMIEIIKFPCNDKNEAAAKEREWYEFLQAKLNSRIPMRHPNEYVPEIFERKKLYKSEWEHNDKIKNPNKYEDKKAKKKVKQACVCGAIVSKGYLRYHIVNKTHFKNMNAKQSII